MRITQGTFSFLPDLSDDQIAKQIQYCIDNGWAVNLEFTDNPHPRNVYWTMWGHPMFDIKDASAAIYELNECRKVYSNYYIRLSAFDNTHGWESVKLSFIVNRPEGEEEGFHLQRTEGVGRNITYTTHAYATNAPAGKRYSDNSSSNGK